MKRKSVEISLELAMLILVFIIGFFMLQENFIYMLKYWGALLIIGVIFFPITSLILNKFDDKGWIFSKILGLGISGLVLWNLSYLKILKFTQLNCYIVIGIIAVINLIVLIKKREKFKNIKEDISSILTSEIIFLIAFMIWVYIRSFIPSINSATEHFMNYGFINKLMNSDYLPVEDIWLSGNTINYYYFGQYISAFLSKVSNTGVQETYNLMIALLAAFTFVLPYLIGENLGRNLIKKDSRRFSNLVPKIIAVLTGLAVCLGGTTYFTIYKMILKEPDYYYANPCYYIGYKTGEPDKAITAFPSYMNLEGDLHAHYIDIMFAFTMLALLLQYMLSDKEENEGKKKNLLSPNIFIIGILLAIQKMTNYWDFPIYLVIIGAVIGVKNFIKCKDIKQKFLITIAQLFEIVVIEEISSLLFSIGLYISATKVYFTHVMTPFYQLAVLWALPVVCILINIGILLYRFFKDKKANKVKIFEYIKNMDLSDIYIIILGICAIGLVILPELIYLKDIYGESYKRANTVFKLTFNAISLFHICTSYILVKYLYEKIPKISKVLILAILVVFITTLGYGIEATKYVTNDFKKESVDIKENAESYIKKELPDDYEAIQWIKENIDRDSVILEETNASSSYKPDTRISVFTANPTVLGWYAHEWVWRADENYQPTEEMKTRLKDISTIYESNNENAVKELIEKYNISYIYVGNIEFKQYKKLNIDMLLNLGEVVYSQENDYKKTPVYIIKVK